MHGAGAEYDNKRGWGKILNLPVYESWNKAVVFVNTVSDKIRFAHTSATSIGRGRQNYYNTKLTQVSVL